MRQNEIGEGNEKLTKTVVEATLEVGGKASVNSDSKLTKETKYLIISKI